jgi:hypothetical protein
LIADVAVMYPEENVFHHAYHVVGVVSTIAFFMYNFTTFISFSIYTATNLGVFYSRINVVSNGQVRGEGAS